MLNSLKFCVYAAVAATAVIASIPVSQAATIPLAGTAGSNQMAYSFEYLQGNPSVPTQQSDYSLAVPGFYTYLNSFGPQSGAPLGTSSVGAYDFQDSYRFTIASGASGDSLVASLGLGTVVAMSDLQFRLYMVSSATTITTSTPTPTVGAIPAGDTVISAWTGVSGVDGPTTTISKTFTGIQAGTYVLDVAGQATGSLGGSYLGSLNLTPVPLPGAAWFLLSGVAGFAVLARKRRLG